MSRRCPGCSASVSTLGAQGDITETLNYDVYAQYYYTQFFN